MNKKENIREILLIITVFTIILSPLIIGTYITINDYKKCKKLNGKYIRGYCLKNQNFINYKGENND